MSSDSTMKDEGEGAISDDEFRKIEKQMRQAAKATIIDLSNSKEAKKQRKLLTRKTRQQEPTISSQIANTSHIFFLQSSIVDVDACPCANAIELHIPNQQYLLENCGNQGMFHPSTRLFSVPQAASGFFVFRNLLPENSQKQWAKVCLSEYSQSTHTNITNLKAIEESSNHNAKSNNAITAHAPSDDALSDVNKSEKCSLLTGLRWASLGYHYDWTTRMYRPDLESPIPTPLATLCTAVANLLHLSLTPEAAIVNYYPLNGHMSGHVDDAEHCMDEPIVSVSLGCPAVFLLGGRTKATKPIPILLRSGDVVIMSGESRYCYHGIPCLLPLDIAETVFPSGVHYFSGCHKSDSLSHGYNESVDASLPAQVGDGSPVNEEEFVSDYLRNGRINMNSRRVTRTDGVWENKNGSGYKYSSLLYSRSDSSVYANDKKNEIIKQII